MKLGLWLKLQRQEKRKGKLVQTLEEQLEDAGVLWDVPPQWEYRYHLLGKFKEREGHSNVPYDHIEDGMKLGLWLREQRHQKKEGKLVKRLEEQLEDVGIMWDVLSEQWENKFHLLVQFQKRERHSNVPPGHIEDGIKLGRWLSKQREQKKIGKLDSSREKKLQDAGVVFDPYADQWENQYNLLVKFREREGHSNVPKRHIEKKARLGEWLGKQRTQKRRGKLDKSIEKRLENVGVVWEFLSVSNQWENHYNLLVKFRLRERHSNVPQNHIEDGLKLGRWLSGQRIRKKRGKINSSIEKRLEDVGVVWDVYSEQWKKNYRLLVEFQKREGHSNVPQRHKEDGKTLGEWLKKQRKEKKKGKLEKRLDEIGVVWTFFP